MRNEVVGGVGARAKRTAGPYIATNAREKERADAQEHLLQEQVSGSSEATIPPAPDVERDDNAMMTTLERIRLAGCRWLARTGQ